MCRSSSKRFWNPAPGHASCQQEVYRRARKVSPPGSEQGPVVSAWGRSYCEKTSSLRMTLTRSRAWHGIFWAGFARHEVRREFRRKKRVASHQNNLLLTSTVGSYAMPGWLLTAGQAMQRGEYGSHDIEETLTDATDIAINDQLKAGVDILVDGEMRRLDFVMGFYDHLQGVRLLPPRRTMGPEGHDMRPKWQVLEPINAPAGLRTIADFRYLQMTTAGLDRPLKATVPGPFTLSGRLDPGTVYQDRMEIAWALA